MAMTNKTPSSNQVHRDPRDPRSRAKEAYYEIHDMISEANDMDQLLRAAEKSLKIMSQSSMDEIARDQLERHANRRYNQLIIEDRRISREMIANKHRS